MRITTNQIFSNATRGIMENQSEVSKTQQQLSSGKRILVGSDDPVGSTKVIRLTEELSSIEQYKRNGIILVNKLERAETLLSSMFDMASRAKVLLQQANSGANSDEDRKGIALELEGIRDQLFDTMNSKDENGNFIFSGSKNNDQTMQLNATTGLYQYQGNEDTNQIQVGSYAKIEVIEHGKNLFQVSDSPNVSVTPSASVTVRSDDNQLFNQTFAYNQIDPTQNVYNFTVNGTGSVDVTDSTGAAVTGSPVAYASPLSFQGAEVTMPAAAGTTFQMTVNEPSGNLLNTLTRMADILGDSSISSQTRSSQLVVASSEMDIGQNALLTGQAMIGGRINRATAAESANADQEITLRSEISSIEDVDFAEAASRLAQQEATLNAALSSFSKISSLSLFNFI